MFDRFIDERIANYDNPENTLKGYLGTLNQIVKNTKKPFSQITYEDLIPILKEWKKKYSKASLHGRKCKLKAFFRWESGNKNDSRVDEIRTGGYVSPITIHDLLTEDEILKMREVAKEDARDLAMLDFHLLWGPRPSESAKLNIGDIKVTDRYIVVSIPQTKTIFRPLPIPLAKASSIKDPEFLDSALNAFVSMMHYLNAQNIRIVSYL